MGSGLWSTDVYEEARKHREHTGASAFTYSREFFDRPDHERRVHNKMNPFGVSRDSCDSDEHPTARAVTVITDVTGSMSTLPGVILNRLGQLHGLLQRKGYLADPQMLFGAVGDATCDRVSLQIGQFESDNRMEDDLSRIVLEGGGGGSNTESYELALYFLARHTRIDCWERRRERGYVFIIGDEKAYPAVKPQEVKRIIGDTLQTAIPIAEMVRELRQRYHVFYMLPGAANHGGDPEILGFWRALLGQNVIELDHVEDACETIALAIGLTEGAISLDDGLDHLRDLGAEESTVRAVSKALTVIPIGRALARSQGALPTLASTGTEPAPRTRRL